MKRRVFGVLFFGFILGIQGSAQDLAHKGSGVERAWDGLVRAKGGREKLHSVRTMIRRWGNTTELNAPPHYQWTFGQSIIGNVVSLNVIDAKKGFIIYAGTGGVTDESSAEDYEATWLPVGILPFMLETNWYRPQLVQVSRKVIGKTKLEVIETKVGSERLDFLYEPEEMMVREIWFYSEGKLIEKVGFADYRPVNGIMMPHKFDYVISAQKKVFLKEIQPDTQISYEFNVEYDQRIFQPPFKATTSDAWKTKG